METIDIQDNLKSYLLERYEWYEAQLLDGVRAAGYSSLTPAQARVFGRLKGQSRNISDLAKLLQVSRQAAQKTVAGLVEMGLLELTPCPENKSAKVVSITKQGHQLRQVAAEEMTKIESRIAKKIGQEAFDNLKQCMRVSWD
ncbi:MarR family winged helix-turn-helix transcriptional regulator [Litoribacillus peritrichatus]|uniref:HTH marR-type domain-containing protein n=1 Tax=Litoribacillus peritrichatus TaxID=718191 RepID=A0ABP7M7D8_9GAMM